MEGVSIRSVDRITGIQRDTIMRLMMRTGQGGANLTDSSMHNLKCQNVQTDEIWCFVGKKPRHLKDTDNLEELGDPWVFVALDADSKLIPSYLEAPGWDEKKSACLAAGYQKTRRAFILVNARGMGVQLLEPGCGQGGAATLSHPFIHPPRRRGYT